MSHGEPAVKRAYVRVVRIVTVIVPPSTAALAPNPSRWELVRHHLRTLPAIYDVQALVRLGVPWWTYRAIVAVGDWFAERTEPVRAFEYGSGASTVWLAERCSEVHTVEHDTRFARMMVPHLDRFPHVHLHVHPPTPITDPAAAVRSDRSGYEHLDFSGYVAEIDAVEGDFDLVVIDGRARADALDRARARLRPGGIIVFDNANRARYRDVITDTDLPVRWLRGRTPALPYPTTTAVLGPAPTR